MPLDPIFRSRLRTHRRYLLQRALDGMLTKLAPRRRADAAGAAAGTKSSQGAAPRLSPRARHRRAALAWDRHELATVGVAGPSLTTHEFVVPVAGHPDVRVRLYVPPGDDGRLRPAVLSFFGGAFRIGGIDYPSTDAVNRRRAAEADVVVVAVDYALAPEHRFPAQVEQGYAALAWLRANADAMGVDATRIGLAGTSAGAAIAASVALMNRDRGGAALRMQVLEVPVVELTGRHLDLRATWALGIPAFIALRELRSVARTYLGRPRDALDAYASPLRAASHRDLPPALILTAEYDPLRSQGAAYGRALRAAGVDATVVRYLGVTHDAPMFTGVLPAARAWHAQVVGQLARLHE